jgi:mycoredoxin-dependent peroxiredoxin
VPAGWRRISTKSNARFQGRKPDFSWAAIFPDLNAGAKSSAPELVWSVGIGKLLAGFQNDGGSTMSISVGQKAPDFTLQNQDKMDVKLSDYAGKKNVVVVWYPLDWSPTCTNEHACFVNEMKSFETLDAEVLGISVDSTWSHKAYADKMGIKYSLLADFHPKGAASEKYGVYLADKGITGRAIAIVNKAGNIAWFKNYDIPVVPDLKEVATALGQVKAATA